jgi:hypothetical protein
LKNKKKWIVSVCHEFWSFIAKNNSNIWKKKLLLIRLAID